MCRARTTVSCFVQSSREECLKEPTRCPEDLPTELLMLIFDLYQEEGTNTSPWNQFPTQTQPTRQTRRAFSLSGVCRRWRSIAQSIPQLWTDVRFTFSSQPRTVADCELLALQLTLSQDLPLKIHLKCCTVQKASSRLLSRLSKPTRFCEWIIIQLILNQQHRWQSLELDDEDKQNLQLFKALRFHPQLQSEPIECPILSTLSLDIPPEAIFRTQSSSNGLFGHCPSLAHLRLRSNRKWEYLGEGIPELPWTQLEYLQLENLTNRTLQWFLQAASEQGSSKLTTLGLVDCKWMSMPPSPSHVVRFPALKKVYSMRNVNIYGLFDAPALENVTMFSPSYYPELICHINRSHSSILSLQIALKPRLEGLLKEMPELQDLSIDIRNTRTQDVQAFAREFSSLLDSTPESHTEDRPFKYCSKLRHLSIHGTGSTSSEDGDGDNASSIALFDMLDRRLSLISGTAGFADDDLRQVLPGTGMQLIELFYHNSIWKTGFASRIHALRDRGAQVVIHSGKEALVCLIISIRRANMTFCRARLTLLLHRLLQDVGISTSDHSLSDFRQQWALGGIAGGCGGCVVGIRSGGWNRVGEQ